MNKLTRMALLVSAGALIALPNAAKAADINTLVAACAGCHGTDGAGTNPNVPIIGGQSGPYIVAALEFFKEKGRPCTEVEITAGAAKGQKSDMCKIAEPFSEADRGAIAAYFAGKTFVRGAQAANTAVVQKGKEVAEKNCKICHTIDGGVATEDHVLLGGQWMPYLRKTFDEYNAGSRRMNPKMKKVFATLDKDDVDAVINYLGSVK